MNIRACNTAEVSLRLLALRTLLTLASTLLTYPVWCAAPPFHRPGAAQPELPICQHSPTDQLLQGSAPNAGICSLAQAPGSDPSDTAIDSSQCLNAEAAYSLDERCDLELAEHELPANKDLKLADETSWFREEAAAQQPAGDTPPLVVQQFLLPHLTA